MSSLYSIELKYLSLMEDLEAAEGITTEEQNKELDITLEQFAEKSDQYSKIIKNIEGQVALAEKEIERINKYISVKNNLIAKLEQQLLQAIMLFGTKEEKVDKKTQKVSIIYRYEVGNFRLSTRKSPSRVEVDEELIDGKWKEITIKDRLTIEELARVSDLLGKSFETTITILKKPIKEAIENNEFVVGATIVEGNYNLVLK